MLISGLFGRKNIGDLDVNLIFPAETFAQTEAPVGIELINRRKRMPAFLISIHAGDYEAFFPFVGARSSETRYLSMSFASRGAHAINRLHVSSVFPFNFFTRYKRIAKEIEFVVYPKPVRCQMTDINNREARKKGDVPTNVTGFESDLISIRDYAPGDPIKYISWKSTAKTGQLKTKELSTIQSQVVIIEFDKMDRRDIEHALSCVTYLIVKLTRSSIPVGLLIDGELIRPGASPAQKARMLTKLALYG